MNIRKAYDLARAMNYDDFMTELRRDIAGVPITVQSDVDFEVIRKVAGTPSTDKLLDRVYEIEPNNKLREIVYTTDEKGAVEFGEALRDIQNDVNTSTKVIGQIWFSSNIEELI